MSNPGQIKHKIKKKNKIKSIKKNFLKTSRIYPLNKLDYPRIFTKKDLIVTFYVLNNNFFYTQVALMFQMILMSFFFFFFSKILISFHFFLHYIKLFTITQIQIQY